MATATDRPMTVAEFLALPEDGTRRELILGRVVVEEENPEEEPMTMRVNPHTGAAALMAAELVFWLRTRPEPRGRVDVGEAGFILPTEPETFVGIDLTYTAPDVPLAGPDEPAYYRGTPTLAVEILSPSNTHKQTRRKIALYQSVGVPLIWIADPDVRTVTAYELGRPPVMFNHTQELTAEPHLPGFRAAVADLFR